MEKYLWQKALLNLYHRLEGMKASKDREIDRMAIGASPKHNLQTLFDDMFDVMKKRNNCALAKEIVDKAFDKLMKEDKNILISRYSNNLSFKEIAVKHCINLRQVFRNYNKELAYFSFLLSQDGYSAKELEAEFKDDALFFAAYRKELERASAKNESFVKIPLHYEDGKTKDKMSTRVQMEGRFY